VHVYHKGTVNTVHARTSCVLTSLFTHVYQYMCINVAKARTRSHFVVRSSSRVGCACIEPADGPCGTRSHPLASQQQQRHDNPVRAYINAVAGVLRDLCSIPCSNGEEACADILVGLAQHPGQEDCCHCCSAVEGCVPSAVSAAHLTHFYSLHAMQQLPQLCQRLLSHYPHRRCPPRT
jgi:hypothetical protein